MDAVTDSVVELLTKYDKLLSAYAELLESLLNQRRRDDDAIDDLRADLIALSNRLEGVTRLVNTRPGVTP